MSSSQNIGYQGIEGGMDCGLLRVNGSDWNVHGGLTGGQMKGQVTQTDGSGKTDVNIPFFGAYAFARNGSFVLDVSARRELINADFTNVTAGLAKTPVDGTTNALALYTSYLIPLQDKVTLTPYAGVTWSRTEMDSFNIYEGMGGALSGRVKPGSNDMSIGRLGVQVGYLHQLASTFYLQPFGGVSFWDAFQNEFEPELYLR